MLVFLGLRDLDLLADSGLKDLARLARPQMDLESVGKESPPAVLTGNESFCVPLLVCPLIVIINHHADTLVCQFARLCSLYHSVELFWCLWTEPTLLLRKLGLLVVPFFTARLQMNFQALGTILSPANVASKRIRSSCSGPSLINKHFHNLN